VAVRGEVLALRRAVGFLPKARLERFVIVQADSVTRALETVLVAPLDEALPVYGAMPGALAVSAREAGTRKGQVALLTSLATVALERFEVLPGRQARPFDKPPARCSAAARARAALGRSITSAPGGVAAVERSGLSRSAGA
jgi:hypothetical protein